MVAGLVVACIRAFLLLHASSRSLAADSALLCACTSPSYRNCILGAYVLYGWLRTALLRYRVGYRREVSVLVSYSAWRATRLVVSSGACGITPGSSPVQGSSRAILYTILSGSASTKCGPLDA